MEYDDLTVDNAMQKVAGVMNRNTSDAENLRPTITRSLDHVSSYLGWKQWLDRLVAAFLLLPGFPMICALVILVRFTSKGPGLYSQERVGKNGKVFTMYKLRSMSCDAECKTGPVWSAVGRDSRVTRVGYWLRKLHLDELPQLFNVLRGEMSLIGPRPERPEFVHVLADSIPGYLDRLRMVPGITGLAQINLPPDTDLNSVRRKLVLDLEYIRTANILLDLRVLLCTLFRMVGVKGEYAMRLMWLVRTASICEVAIVAHPSGDEAEITPEFVAISASVDERIPITPQNAHAGSRERLSVPHSEAAAFSAGR